MNILFVNICAVVLYAAGSGYLIRAVVKSQTVNKQAFFLLTACALMAHGLGCYLLILQPDGLALGIFSALSLIFFTVNTIVLISYLKQPVQNLFILLLPQTIIAIICAQLLQNTDHVIPITLDLASHVLLSIIAYSLLTIATLQALFLAYQNHQLKRKRALSTLRLMPPLQTMETLLFEMLWAGQILLTLSIISGMLFLDDPFAAKMAYKTVFILTAWLIYGVLLWGRHFLGWRGYVAIRWTLVGFVLMMLAYFGSKFVFEFVLN